MHERILVPTLTYSSKVMVWIAGDRSRVKAVEMSSLRNILGVSRMEWENKRVMWTCGAHKSFYVRISENLFIIIIIIRTHFDCENVCAQ